jgi:hypothetical protein
MLDITLMEITLKVNTHIGISAHLCNMQGVSSPVFIDAILRIADRFTIQQHHDNSFMVDRI